MIDTGVREADLWIGEMRGVDVAGCPVLLVRHERGVSAYRDRCPHQGYRLSEGQLEGDTITCRAHLHQFSATSGEGINPPRPCLVRLPLLVTEGSLTVELPP